MATSSATKTTRLLLVGCGDIGSRHLQAVCTLPSVSSIDVVDTRSQGLELGKTRVQEISDRNEKIEYQWLTSLGEGSADLCIVGTMAAGRTALIKDIVRKTGTKRFLLEKVVTQSLAEYDELLAFAEANQLSIWINCKTRTYPFHKATIKKFKEGEPLQFSINAGNHGLMTNGLHNIDLFVFYDKCERIDYVGGRLDPILHPQKRGNNLSDLSGSLMGVSDKGSTLLISFASDHKAPDIYTVGSHRYRFMVDHFNRLAFEASPEDDWVWKPLPFEGDLMVSTMSKKFVSDILSTGNCELPTLRDCYPAHAFLFKALHPTFNKLYGRELSSLPIT